MDDADVTDRSPPTGRSALRRAADVAVVDVDGELIVFHEATDRVHVLNRTAALLWSLLDGGGSSDELSFELAEVFGVPLDVVRRDVRTGVASLANTGLLHDVADPPAPPSSGGAPPARTELRDPSSAEAESRVLGEPPDT